MNTPYTIIAGGLEMTVTRKPVKNITVRIKNGNVLVSAPAEMDEQLLRSILAGQAEKYRGRAEIQKKKDPVPFADGKPILFLGKIYAQQYTNSRFRWSACADENDMIMYISCPENWTQEEKKEFFRAWYCRKLEELLNELMPKWEKALGLYTEGWNTDFRKTRWGCCNTVKKTIAFNGMLAQAPVTVIESVILHELLHLKYPNHQKEFHEAMNEYMPEYKACDEYLKRFDNLLL